MPEGPECRITAEALNKLLKGRLTITTQGSYSEKPQYATLRKDLQALLNPTIVQVMPKGKNIFMLLRQSDGVIKYVANHLGLDGSWTKVPNKHTCIKVESEKETLYFNDITRLGEFDILTEDEMRERLTTIGVDPYTHDFTYNAMVTALNDDSKKKIAIVLMDQSKVCGIGNYLRAEILYHSKLNPRKMIKDFTNENWRNLFYSIKGVMDEVYSMNGSIAYPGLKVTDTAEPRALVGPGKYNFLVYSKSVTPKGEKVDQFTMAGRTVYWCPSVQDE
jgi:formamidopyrimidine-DNA glycosylase